MSYAIRIVPSPSPLGPSRPTGSVVGLPGDRRTRRRRERRYQRYINAHIRDNFSGQYGPGGATRIPANANFAPHVRTASRWAAAARGGRAAIVAAAAAWAVGEAINALNNVAGDGLVATPGVRLPNQNPGMRVNASGALEYLGRARWDALSYQPWLTVPQPSVVTTWPSTAFNRNYWLYPNPPAFNGAVYRVYEQGQAFVPALALIPNPLAKQAWINNTWAVPGIGPQGVPFFTPFVSPNIAPLAQPGRALGPLNFMAPAEVTVPRPSGRAATAATPVNVFRPPSKGTKETKQNIRNQAVMSVVLLAAEAISEGVDTIEAVYEGLSKKRLREIYKRLGHQPNPYEMVREIINHFGDLNMTAVIVNIVDGSLEDSFYGMLGRVARRGNQALGRSTGVGRASYGYHEGLYSQARDGLLASVGLDPNESYNRRELERAIRLLDPP